MASIKTKEILQDSIAYLKERIEAVNKDREIAQEIHDLKYQQFIKGDSIDYLISAVETLTEVVKVQLGIIDIVSDYIKD